MLNRCLRYCYLQLALLGLTVATVYGQAACPPANIGFESGSFQNWDCKVGKATDFGIVNLTGSAPAFDEHTLISKPVADTDPYGNFPTLCPNGSKYSIRLGNREVGAMAEQVSYTFTIDPGVHDYSLFFNYAVVLQNPNHVAAQQPRFTAKVYDVTDGTYIDCASFDFVAGAGLPGFKQSKLDFTVFYKDWATANINLQGYAGKTIRIEFTTNDCTVGGHFGYAYLDLIQDCVLPINGNTYCASQNEVNLTGPPGFDKYEWFDTSNKLVGTGSALKLSPPPPDNTPYTLLLTPLAGLGCVTALTTVVSKSAEDFNFIVKDTVLMCPNGSADLTAASVTAGSTPGLTLSYLTDIDGNAHLYDPNAITQTGTYFIKATNAGGCTSTLPVVVSVTDSIITRVADPKPAIYPATVDLGTTFTHANKIDYTYYKDAGGKDTVSQQVGQSGTYYIRSTNYLGCSFFEPVHVVISPPGLANILAPNAFTPNGDGVNDYFYLNVNGFEALKSLKIYNRYGKVVFETKNAGTKWDGNYSGQPVSTGVYYWVYEGASTYDNTPSKHAGYVTIVR